MRRCERKYRLIRNQRSREPTSKERPTRLHPSASPENTALRSGSLDIMLPWHIPMPQADMHKEA